MLIEDLRGQLGCKDVSAAHMAKFLEICQGINDESLDIPKELAAEIRELAKDRNRLYTFRLATTKEREALKVKASFPIVIMDSSHELLAALAKVSRELEPKPRKERPEPRYFVG